MPTSRAEAVRPRAYHAEMPSWEEIARAAPELAGGPQPGDVYRVDVAEVVLVSIGDPPDHLVVESWREGSAVRRVERR